MVTVYGADWCEDTQRSRRHLRRLGVSHRYFNIDEDLGALERAKALNEGRRRTPLVELDGEVLVEPLNETLRNALVRHAELSEEEAIARRHVQNVGDLERVLRAGAGSLALLLAAHGPRALRLPMALAGLAVLTTGVAGWCPVYAGSRVTSLEGPGDRPGEAQRTEWLEEAD